MKIGKIKTLVTLSNIPKSKQKAPKNILSDLACYKSLAYYYSGKKIKISGRKDKAVGYFKKGLKSLRACQEGNHSQDHFLAQAFSSSLTHFYKGLFWYQIWAVNKNKRAQELALSSWEKSAKISKDKRLKSYAQKNQKTLRVALKVNKKNG